MRQHVEYVADIATPSTDSSLPVGAPTSRPPVRVVRSATRYECFVKPVFDRAVAGVLLVLFAPVIAVVGCTVLVTLGRPVLLRQERIGRDGAPFAMLKFRTMRPDRRAQAVPFDGSDRRQRHKSADDPRHVPVGRVLRALSLDELPQLINVWRGDMSLVGPRPELPFIVERHYRPHHHARHLVRPGITGLWQVTERADTERLMHTCVDTDLRYVERLTFRHDLTILARTVPVLLGIGKGS
jgi:lipopolysaccharide/colanic/teichoic acid biosynthesis glycosyltransferase